MYYYLINMQQIHTYIPDNIVFSLTSQFFTAFLLKQLLRVCHHI